MGFVPGRESARMEASAEHIRRNTDPAAGSCAETATEDDAGEIMALLRKSFDPLFAFLPGEKELKQAISQGRVWIVRRADKVAAVLHSREEKNYAVIAHMAVAERFRGLGLAGDLLRCYHRMNVERVRGFRHWVDVNNAAAVHLYTESGYVFGTRRANEYVYRGGS